MTAEELVAEDVKQSFQKAIQQVSKMEWGKYQAPDYYTKRRYGKYTIYNREGWRVAWGLNEKEMKNYMKLLKKEE